MQYPSAVDIREIALLRIKRRRNALGLSQEAAGARAKMTKQTYARYESGFTQLDLESLQLIAKALEITPESLIAPDPDLKPLSREIAETSQDLSDKDQQEILEFIRLKLRLSRTGQVATGEADKSPKAHTRRQGE